MASSAKAEPQPLYQPLSTKKGRDALALSPVSNFMLNMLLFFCCVAALIPLYVIFISSITSEASLTANGYRLWPQKFSGMAYTFLFSQGSIVITAYINTTISTVV